MKKLFRNKVNVTLFSGFLLGILFVVACNASGDNSGKIQTPSALSVYNASGAKMGTFLGFWAGGILPSLLLSDGKILNEVFEGIEAVSVLVGTSAYSVFLRLQIVQELPTSPRLMKV